MPRPAIGWRAWSIGCTSTRCWPAAATVRISAGWAASIEPRRTTPSPRTIGCWRPGSRWRTTDRRAAAAESKRILDEVELAAVSPQGAPSGPDYPHYWIDKVRPGLARLWPLPWPGRYDRAGWRTILVSWLLMLLIAALAVLIAILIFRNQPPQTPPHADGRIGQPTTVGVGLAAVRIASVGVAPVRVPVGIGVRVSVGFAVGLASPGHRRRPVGALRRRAAPSPVVDNRRRRRRRSGKQLAGLPAVSSTETDRDPPTPVGGHRPGRHLPLPRRQRQRRTIGRRCRPRRRRGRTSSSSPDGRCAGSTSSRICRAPTRR